MATPLRTSGELEAALGQRLKALCLDRNIDQASLAERAAGISGRALRNLEGGLGSTWRTLTSVLRAPGREDWLEAVAPVAAIDPSPLERHGKPRQRSSRSRTQRPPA